MIMGDPRGGAYRRASLFIPAVIGPTGRAGNTAMASEHSGQGRRNRLLAALTSADYSLLAPHLKELSLELGSLLQEPGEPVQQIYFPHQGMISLLAVMSDGQGIETATVGSEGVLEQWLDSASARVLRGRSSRLPWWLRAFPVCIFTRPFRKVRASEI